MEVTIHASRHRKRNVSIVLGEPTAQPPEKSVKREEGESDSSHQQQQQQQHHPAAVAPPPPSLASTATSSSGGCSSFSISSILAGTDETSSSSLTMTSNENVDSPKSPPQTELDLYRNLPHGTTRGVQHQLRMQDAEAPHSGVNSAISGYPSDPRIARILSSTRDNVETEPQATDAVPAEPAAPAVAHLMDPGLSADTDFAIDVSDDEAERQSTLSSVKREAESVCSSEVEYRDKYFAEMENSLKLQQKLLNMEKQLAMTKDMLQDERKAKEGAELRAGQAEKLLKSQNDRDEVKHSELLNMKVELAAKDEMLERERRAKEEAESRADKAEKLFKSQRPHRNELNWRSIEKSEMEKKMTELKKEKVELTEKMEKKEKRASESISDLKHQLEKEKKRNDKSVDELKSKLAKYEDSKQVLRLMAKIAKRKIDPRIDEEADPNDIIRLLKSRAKDAMPVDKAVEKVRAAFGKCGERAKKKMSEDKREWFACDPCGIEVHNMLDATTHFLSEDHIKKVHNFHKPSVSELAVKRWVKEIDRLN